MQRRNGTHAIVFHCLVIGFILSPLLIIVLVAFTPENTLSIPTSDFSLRWFKAFFQHSDLPSAFFNSIKLSSAAAILATCIAVPSAIAISRYEFPGRNFINGLFLSPIIIPSLVLGIALLRFFSAVGGTGNFGWLILAHTIVATPYTLRLIMAALIGYDKSIENAAYSLGASSWTVFRRIILPIILPGIAGGFLLAFINSFDEVTMTIFVTSPSTITLPVRMYMYATDSIDPLMAAVATLNILFTAVVMGLIDRIYGMEKLLVGKG